MICLGVFGHPEVPGKCSALSFVTRERRWRQDFFLLCPCSKFVWLLLCKILWKQGTPGDGGQLVCGRSIFNVSFTGICKGSFTDLWIIDSFRRAPAL